MIFRYTLLFVFIVFSFCLSAQAKVSDIEKTYNPEQLSLLLETSSRIYQEQWKGNSYLITSFDHSLTFTNLDSYNEDPFTIPLEINCANSITSLVGIKGDYLYLRAHKFILEVDLINKAQVRRFVLPGSIRNTTVWLGTSAILFDYISEINNQKVISALDLNNGELHTKAISSGSKITFRENKFIASNQTNGSITSYDLVLDQEVEIFSGFGFSIIKTNQVTANLYFYDDSNNFYSYDFSEEAKIICSDFYPKEISFTDGKYLYTKDYFSSIILIYSLQNCQYLDHASSDYLYSEVVTTAEGMSTFLYSSYNVVKVDHQDFKITTYNINNEGFSFRHFMGDKVYFISLDKNKRILLNSLNLQTGNQSTYSTLESKSLLEKLYLSINKHSEISLISTIDQRLTTIQYDSLFNEISRKTLTKSVDYGLLTESQVWQTEQATKYLNVTNKVLHYDGDSLHQINDFPYHTGNIISDGILYGYVNRSGSTFFEITDIENDTILHQKEVGYSELWVPHEIFKLSDNIYLKEFSGKIRKVYPEENTEFLDLPNKIREIYHRANDKILVLTDKNDLAWFDGESFEVMQNDVNSYALTYQNWNQNSVIKTLVIDIDKGVGIFSFDEETGASFINERYDTGFYINRNYDQSGKEWKVIATFNSDNDNITLYACNGNQIKNIDLQELKFEGISDSYSYVNGHLFFSNSNNKSYAYSELTGIVDLTSLFQNQIITDVYYENNRYYITTYDNDEVFVRSLNQELDLVEDIFSSSISDCSTLRDHYFIGKKDDENLLLVLSTADWGKEIWNLSLASEEVTLINDINDGPLSGFQKIEFIEGNVLFFTAKTDRNNTQLYKIDIQNELANSVKQEEFKKLNIFPNPVSQYLHLNESLDNIIIYDVKGKIVMQQFLKTNLVDVEKLESGIFFIRGNTDSSNYQAKFIKI